MNKLIYIALLLAAALITSCSTTSTNDDKLATVLEKMELEQGEIQDRILNYRVNSWKYVDTKHIILEARRKEYYLVRLRTPCFGLSSAMDIGFTSFGSSLSKFEKIVVRDSNGPDESCSIKEIFQLVPIQANNDKTRNSETPKEDDN